MGLFIMKRSQLAYLKKKTDFAKLRLLLHNPLARMALWGVTRTDKDGRMRLRELMDRWASGRKPPPLDIQDHALRSVLEVIRRAIGIPEEKMTECLLHPNIRRTIENAALTLDKESLRMPIRFYAPLMVVWNLTYACNLRCKHCYQNAGPLRRGAAPAELTLEEKLKAIDDIADSYIPTLSFSGGEPMMSPDFWAVAEHAHRRGLYISIATNGTLIDDEAARRFEELDFAYIGISLDSPYPEVHDEFRGVKGAWERTVEGFKRVAASNVAAVLSFTATADNYKSLPEMFELAERLGASKTIVYNLVPVGRADIQRDLTPEQREEVLKMMYDYSVAGESICTTAPQLGRMAREKGRPDLVPLAHLGTGRAHKDLQILAELIGGCGVGRAYCALQPDGRVTPCVYMPDVTVGNVKEKSILDIWRTSPLLKSLADRSDLKGNCAVCESKEVCGGCRARAYAYFGDFKAPDPGCIRNAAYLPQQPEDVLAAGG